MAKPNSRATLSDYCLRQLGAPILEINVADEQIDDLMDDSLQYFYERHFDGVEKVLLKYQLTEEDKKRGRARGGDNNLGITSTCLLYTSPSPRAKRQYRMPSSA